ncbi:MarR family winged helix-turn-helix transcriptional regulator [Streptomyces sp. NPDC093094]|uniref:MarR family winged helix-turn-helix transcriptional regulator n=1 Tax=Streptomyces sp. NPDC093094 TaxID=3366026 RepID=UPI003826C7E2
MRGVGAASCPDEPSGALARQIVDAVDQLVALWFTAVDEVSPRVPPRGIRALQAVRRRPALNVTALAEQLDVGLPTASRLCDRLEAAGLLERCARPGDRREVHLVMTDRGRRFLADLGERLSARLGGVLDGLPPERRLLLEEMLRSFQEPPDTRRAP